MTEIKKVDAAQAEKYVEMLSLDDRERAAMDYCLVMSANMWIGLVDGGLMCIWGLIPPTLLSNQAYLWLYTTDLLKKHQFVLVRHSQLVIKEALKEYSSVCGHAIIGNDKAIRWLKWLGARFGEPNGMGIPFRIMRND